MSKKLQQITEDTGLEVVIHGGSDRLTVYQNNEGGYSFTFTKASEDMPPYRYANCLASELEETMRYHCSDLRKWHKIQPE